MKKVIIGLSSAAAFLAYSNPAYALDLCGQTEQGIDPSNLCNVTLDVVVTTAVNVGLFVAFVAALLYLIYGGIKWVLSGGDKEATGKAKASVTAALVGLAIVLASWVLINIIFTFFGLSNGLTGLTVPQL